MARDIYFYEVDIHTGKLTKQGEFKYTNSDLTVAHFAYDNKMIYLGDEKGRVASYKLVVKDDMIKSFELVNEFKGMNRPI